MSTQQCEFAKIVCQSQRSTGTCQELELECVQGPGRRGQPEVRGTGAGARPGCEVVAVQEAVPVGNGGAEAVQAAGAGSSSTAGALWGSAWQSCLPSR